MTTTKKKQLRIRANKMMFNVYQMLLLKIYRCDINNSHRFTVSAARKCRLRLKHVRCGALRPTNWLTAKHMVGKHEPCTRNIYRSVGKRQHHVMSLMSSTNV